MLTAHYGEEQLAITSFKMKNKGRLSSMNFELVLLPSLSAAWDENIWRPSEKIAKTVDLFGSSLQPCYRLADSHGTQASRKLWTKWNNQSITESVVACRAIGVPRLRVKSIQDHRHFYCNKMRVTTLVCIFYPVNQQRSRVQLPNDTYNLGWCQMWSPPKHPPHTYLSAWEARRKVPSPWPIEWMSEPAAKVKWTRENEANIHNLSRDKELWVLGFGEERCYFFSFRSFLFSSFLLPPCIPGNLFTKPGVIWG